MMAASPFDEMVIMRKRYFYSLKQSRSLGAQVFHHYKQGKTSNPNIEKKNPKKEKKKIVKQEMAEKI